MTYVKHGYRKAGMTDPLYDRWRGIKNRCFNVKVKDYPNYGGRGIKMYPIWVHDFSAFKKYVETLPDFNLSLKIDRIENSGNYEPGNIRMTTDAVNSTNKRNNILINFRGEAGVRGRLFKKYGFDWRSTAVFNQLKKGLSLSEILEVYVRSEELGYIYKPGDFFQKRIDFIAGEVHDYQG